MIKKDIIKKDIIKKVMINKVLIKKVLIKEDFIKKDFIKGVIFINAITMIIVFINIIKNEGNIIIINNMHMIEKGIDTDMTNMGITKKDIINMDMTKKDIIERDIMK